MSEEEKAAERWENEGGQTKSLAQHQPPQYENSRRKYSFERTSPLNAGEFREGEEF